MSPIERGHRFDLRRLKRSFGAAAERYTEIAVLQRQVETRLLDQLDYLENKRPARILDVGAGPGWASGAMKKRWPASEVIALDLALPMLRQVPRHTRFWRPIRRLCAEATHLPLADASIDMIFSNLCLQWVSDLPLALAEFRRVLREGGLLLFTTFGPDTLIELREAYLQAGESDPPLSPFAAIQQIGDALMAAGFRDPVLDRERFTLTYPQVSALLRELRAIGAGDARLRRSRGLGGKDRQARMIAAYESQRRSDGSLPSSWEVINAMAWAPAPGAPRREAGVDIASFPVDRIPRRRR